MYKITKTYNDFNGEEKTEDFYFNLTTNELVAWSTRDGGMEAHVQKMIGVKNVSEMFDLTKELALLAYGIKSADGRHFIKTPEEAQLFRCHAAFDALIMDLATDEQKASEFINRVVPKELADNIAKLQGEDKLKAAAASLPPIQA